MAVSCKDILIITFNTLNALAKINGDPGQRTTLKKKIKIQNFTVIRKLHVTKVLRVKASSHIGECMNADLR